MAKLTKRIVDTASARSKPYFVWCSELSGFGVRIFPSGRKIYYADYRTAAGMRRRMSIGLHGKLTPEEARREAAIKLADVLKGSDPVDERATRRNSLTVGELCDKYFAATDRQLILGKRGLPKKASTLSTDRGRVERHIKPLLGRKLVRDITIVDVIKFMRDVASGKTAAVFRTGKPRGKAIVTGGHGTAARTVGLLGGIFSYAVSEGLIALNPVRGVRRPAGGQRQRRLNPQEYRRLGNALTKVKAELPQVIHGAHLLAITGWRLGEIVNLKWSELDFEHRCVRFADTKEGPSSRPLSAASIRVLRRIERHADNPYVLTGGSQNGNYGGLPRAWRRLATAAELQAVTPHSMRHSFASIANDLGLTLVTVAALLGHSTRTVTGKYVHHIDEFLVAAVDRVADEIERQMAGRATRASTAASPKGVKRGHRQPIGKSLS